MAPTVTRAQIQNRTLRQQYARGGLRNMGAPAFSPTAASGAATQESTILSQMRAAGVNMQGTGAGQIQGPPPSLGSQYHPPADYRGRPFGGPSPIQFPNPITTAAQHAQAVQLGIQQGNITPSGPLASLIPMYNQPSGVGGLAIPPFPGRSPGSPGAGAGGGVVPRTLAAGLNNQQGAVVPDQAGNWIDPKTGTTYKNVQGNGQGSYTGVNEQGQQVFIDQSGAVTVVGFNPNQIFPVSQTHPYPLALTLNDLGQTPPGGGGGGGYGGFGSRYGGRGGGGYGGGGGQGGYGLNAYLTNWNI